MNGTSELVYNIRNLSKRRPGAAGTAFDFWVSEFGIRQGDRLAVTGPSGCGKSTFLDILALVLEPDSADRFLFASPGEEVVDVERAWTQRKLDTLATVRGYHLGYVLQAGGLLAFLTVEQNIEAPRQIRGLPDDGTVESLGERLGILGHFAKRPGQLSIGERQRVAIARALSHRPSVVLADEPTASLDPVTARSVIELLMELMVEQGVTAVVATHDWDLVQSFGMERILVTTKQDTSGKGVRATLEQGDQWA
jgi:putative ABC transport system ATP-binding protein